MAVVLALVAAPPSPAAMLCAKKSGAVVLRDACRKKETAVVSPAIVGPDGAPGTPGVAGTPGAMPYDLVDANGHRFGTLVSIEGYRSYSIVQPPALDVPLVFEVSVGEFSFAGDPASYARVYYAAAGCQGTPLVQAGSSLVPTAEVVGDRVFFLRQQGPFTVTSVASSEASGACGGGTPTVHGTCCVDSSQMVFASPAEVVDLATFGVVAPFTVVKR